MGNTLGWDVSSWEPWPVQNVGVRKATQQVTFGKELGITLSGLFLCWDWAERRIRVEQWG